jgi:hypothetical protein
VRIVRNDKAVHSYRDAQGFRINGRKLNVKLIDAYIYHYGWVKKPEGIIKKLHSFTQFYIGDQWNPAEPQSFDFDYNNADNLVKFTDTPPAVMKNRMAINNWKLNLNEVKSRMSFRRKLLQTVESITGWRIGEYRNYKIVK